MSEEILSSAQRAQLRAYAGASRTASNGQQDGGEADDAALLGVVADRIGMTGELAVDPEGGLELERDDVLVALGAIPEDQAHEVEHPEMLYVAVYVRPSSDEHRRALQEAELLDADEDLDEMDEGWLSTWWGSGCTTMPRSTPLPDQMQALERIMTAAEDALDALDVEVYGTAVGELYLGDEDGEFE